MNLEEIYFLTQIGVGVAVIISIIFVGLELRQNSFLMRKSMGDTRKERVNWLFEQLTIDEEFRTFFQIHYEVIGPCGGPASCGPSRFI